MKAQLGEGGPSLKDMESASPPKAKSVDQNYAKRVMGKYQNTPKAAVKRTRKRRAAKR